MQDANDEEKSLPKVKRLTTTSTFSPTNLAEQDAIHLNQLTATVYSASAAIPKGASEAAARHGLLSSSLIQGNNITINQATITQINASTMMIAASNQAPAIRTQDLQQQLEYYYRHYDSHIKRVFGNPIPLSSCFINLAIVTGESQKNDETERLRSQSERSKIYCSYEDIFSTSQKVEIAPETLFNLRNNKIPKRIAIIGRAGIGKSTLSQYLCAYLWGERNVWKDKFKAVLRIKLRNLVNDPYTRSSKLADIVEAECLDKTGLTQTLNKNDITATLQAISEETLVILDGWDEYDQYRSPCAAVIEGIMADPKISIIVLSRPYTNLNPRQFDLQLECIGFTSENIPEYINRALDDKTQAPLIIEFLKRNPAIHSLAHVPIILDMICAVWDEEMRLLETPMTMTELYNKLISRFWQAYKQKQREAHPDITLADLNKKKENVSTFLGLLAFNAMSTNSIMLNYEIIKSAIKATYQCSDEDVKDYLQEVLPPGFLNTPDHNQTTGRYYFPHLTVQEYFAAMHWVKLFTASDNATRDDARHILKLNKFNPQFEIMWWLASGLLNAYPNNQYLQEFFDYLEEPPIDVIGLYSKRLMIRCLGEANVAHNLRQTSRLLQLACDSIHQGVISKLDDRRLEKFTLLSAIILNYKVAVRCGITEIVISILSVSDNDLLNSAMHVLLRLANAGINLPNIIDAFQQLSAIKKEKTPDKVKKFLQKHAVLPLEINASPLQQAAAPSLQNQAQDKALRNITITDHSILTGVTIATYLESTDQTELMTAIQTLLQKIQNGDRWQASASVSALSSLCCTKRILDENIFQTLASASRSEHWQIRASVAITLGQLLDVCEFLPDWHNKIEQLTYEMSSDINEDVMKQLDKPINKLFESIKSKGNLDNQKMFLYMELFKNCKVTEAQIKFMNFIQAFYISNGLEHIHLFIEIALNLQNSSLKRQAITCIDQLVEKYGFNEPILRFILKMLEDEDSTVITRGLWCIPTLAKKNPSAINYEDLLIKNFNHPKASVCQIALKMTGAVSSTLNLSESIIDKIITITQSDNGYNAGVAIQALGAIASNHQFAMKIVSYFNGVLHHNLAQTHIHHGNTYSFDSTKNEVVEVFRHLLKTSNLEEGNIAVSALLKLFNQQCEWIGGGAATVLRDTNLAPYLDLPEWRMFDFTLKKIHCDWDQIFNSTPIDALLRSDLVTNEHFFKLVISKKILEDLQLLTIEENKVYFIKDYRLQSVSFSPEKLNIFIHFLEQFLKNLQINSKFIPVVLPTETAQAQAPSQCQIC